MDCVVRKGPKYEYSKEDSANISRNISNTGRILGDFSYFVVFIHHL